MRFIKRYIKFLLNKIKLHRKVRFDCTVQISPNAEFEGMNKIYPNTIFSGKMGYGSYIGPNSEIYAKIGKYTSIAPKVSVVYGKHPFSRPFVSTSPTFYSLMQQNGGKFTKTQRYKEFSYADEKKKHPIIIGNDCWIGEGALILGGVTINDGAVVLARAVVTKDVPPFAIVGGIPSKVLKYRYNFKTINYLLGIKWWNKSPSWLKVNIDLMNDLDKLQEKYPLQDVGEK